MTREQEIIKSFIEGRPVVSALTNPRLANTVAKAVERDDDADGSRFSLSSETMAKLEKRKANETAIEKARSERGGQVDKNAMRRDILGSDRMAKARARAAFQSKNAARVPYVKVADRR